MMAGDSGFPWQHSFPPFYTQQPHAETRLKQLETWRQIVLDYCRRKGQTSIDVVEIATSDLFNNQAINRRVDGDFLNVILSHLQSKGNLEWSDKTKRRAHIYWRSPEEWARLIYAFVSKSGMNSGSAVCTFFELTEGADTVDEPFHGLETDLLIKSLKILEGQGKAELFQGDEGVKFF